MIEKSLEKKLSTLSFLELKVLEVLIKNYTEHPLIISRAKISRELGFSVIAISTSITALKRLGLIYTSIDSKTHFNKYYILDINEIIPLLEEYKHLLEEK